MTDRNLLTKLFGYPFDFEERKKFESAHMVLFYPAVDYKLPFQRMYINQYIQKPLQHTFSRLYSEGLIHEIRTFNGCFYPRYIRGYEAAKIESLHSWGIAVDFNAKDNPLGLTRQQAIAKGLRPFSEEFLQVWRDTDWVCGADFGRKDGMHFQWSKPFEI